MRYLGNYDVSSQKNTVNRSALRLSGNYFGVAFSQETSIGATAAKSDNKWGEAWYNVDPLYGKSWSEIETKIKETDNSSEVSARRSEIQNLFGKDAAKYLWAANPFSLEWNVFFGDHRNFAFGLSIHMHSDRIAYRYGNTGIGRIGANELLVQSPNSHEVDLVEKDWWRELSKSPNHGMVDAAADLLRQAPFKNVTRATWSELKKWALDTVNQVNGKIDKWYECSVGNTGNFSELKCPSSVGYRYKDWWTVIKTKDNQPSRFLALLYIDQTEKVCLGLTRSQIRDNALKALDSLWSLLYDFCKAIAPPDHKTWWNEYYFGVNAAECPKFGETKEDNFIPLAIEHGNDVEVPIVKLYLTLIYLVMVSMPYPKSKKPERDAFINKLYTLMPPSFDIPWMKKLNNSKKDMIDFLVRYRNLDEKRLAPNFDPTAFPENERQFIGERPYVVIRNNEKGGGDAAKRVGERSGWALVYGVPYEVPYDELLESFKEHTTWWQRNGPIFKSLLLATANIAISSVAPGIGDKIAGKAVGEAIKTVTQTVSSLVINPKIGTTLQQRFSAMQDAQRVLNAVMSSGGMGGKGQSPQDLPLLFIYWWPDQIASQLLRSVLDDPSRGGSGLGSFSSRRPFFTWAEYYWLWTAWYIFNLKIELTIDVTPDKVDPYIPPVWIYSYDKKLSDEAKARAEETAKKQKIVKWIWPVVGGLSALVLGSALYFGLRQKRSQQI